MRRFSPAAITLLLFATGCGEQHGDGEPKSQDFALSLRVEAQGAQVLRLDLPAAALVAIRRPDKGDIRVVDTHGRHLSMAFVEPGVAQQGQIRLGAIPFGQAPGGSHLSPVSVHVEQAGGSISVHAEDGGEPNGPEHSVLFDTRDIKASAVGIALEAALPAQRPVEVSIAAGDDLKNWTPVTEKVLFRPDEGQGMLGGNRIALPAVDLDDRYLRVSWRGEARLNIAGATLFTSTAPSRPRISIPAKGLELDEAHEAVFSMPSGLKPSAIRVTMTGKDGVIPLRALERDNAEAPWTLLAMASLRQGRQGVLGELGSGPARFLKIEADSRSAGFSQAPSIAFLYAPVTLAVAFNGDGPYHLLVGHPGAKPAAFALSDLTDQTGPIGEARVIGAPSQTFVEVASSAAGSAFSARIVALWAALVTGVAMLAYAALRLMRANNAR